MKKTVAFGNHLINKCAEDVSVPSPAPIWSAIALCSQYSEQVNKQNISENITPREMRNWVKQNL